MQGHYARTDRIDVDVVREVFDRLAEGPAGPVELHVHDARHAFVNDTGPAYDEAAATLAWGRATAFLREHVR